MIRYKKSIYVTESCDRRNRVKKKIRIFSQQRKLQIVLQNLSISRRKYNISIQFYKVCRRIQIRMWELDRRKKKQITSTEAFGPDENDKYRIFGLPRETGDISFEETVTILYNIFGESSSLFHARYNVLIFLKMTTRTPSPIQERQIKIVKKNCCVNGMRTCSNV